MPFNFNRKTVFLTYAQCNLLPQEVYDHINAQHPISDYVVARELHQDGNPHIHAFFKFTSQVHSRNEHVFDIAGFHPNIKTPNKKDGIEAVKRYCMKKGDFITNLQLKGKREILFETILEEGLTKKLVLEHPEVMALNFTSISSWVRLARGVTVNPVPVLDMPKKRHLWLYGPANTGKSWWLKRAISLHEYPVQIPTNNDWAYADQNSDLLYYDEFKGQITIQFLNSICDGRVQLNTKGGSTFISYPRVIICSNYSPNAAYPNVDGGIIGTLESRFNLYDFSIRKPKFSTYFVREL